MAVLTHVVPLAVAAREVVLEEDQVSFFEALPPGELRADAREIAHVLVPHDERARAERELVLADVGPADACHLHFHQGRVGRHVRNVQLA